MTIEQLKLYQKDLEDFIISLKFFKCKYAEINSSNPFLRDCIVDGCKDCFNKYCVTHHSGERCSC